MNKKVFGFIVIIFSFATVLLNGQYIPKGFSYQAVARAENGLEMKNKDLDVRVSILPDEPSNNAEYSERHNVRTDHFGLFNIVIGQGSYLSGPVTKFSEINWGSGPHFLKIEIDFGSGYINMGSTQLLAVPYAMHSGTAANAQGSSDDQQIEFNPETKMLTLENGGTANLNSLHQVLSYSKGELTLSPGNTVPLSDLKEDADHDTTNELQSLSFNNGKLQISKGNAVTIPNEKQGLIIDSNHKLRITSDTTIKQVDLAPYLVDNQNLVTSGDTIKITRGNFILSDNSTSNEIQSLRRSNDTIYLSKGGGIVKLPEDKVDDADHDPANELQRLEINGTNLSITPGGNTINIRPDIIAFRAFKSNGGSGYPTGQIVKLEFSDSLDISNCFTNGTFTVPIGGGGLYFFEITYKFDSNQYLCIYKNGIKKEDVFGTWGMNLNGINSMPFILYLNDNDKVEVFSTFINFGSTQPGIFMGYRIH
jgi:hypothetical protein